MKLIRNRYTSTHLGVKLDLERQVMECMYLHHRIHSDYRKYFFFNEIQEMSTVKKSSLERILPRLIKRKWIKREEIKIYPKIKRSAKPFTHKIRKNYKIPKLKNVKIRMAYKIIEFPYLYRMRIAKKGSTTRTAWHVDEGTRRFWKNSAKDMLELRKFFKDEIEIIDVRKRLRSRL